MWVWEGGVHQLSWLHLFLLWLNIFSFQFQLSAPGQQWAICYLWSHVGFFFSYISYDVEFQLCVTGNTRIWHWSMIILVLQWRIRFEQELCASTILFFIEQQNLMHSQHKIALILLFSLDLCNLLSNLGWWISLILHTFSDIPVYSFTSGLQWDSAVSLPQLRMSIAPHTFTSLFVAQMAGLHFLHCFLAAQELWTFIAQASTCGHVTRATAWTRAVEICWRNHPWRLRCNFRNICI